MQEQEDAEQADYPEHGMDCYVCGASVATQPGEVEMPEGWGFVLVAGRCSDGLPGLEPMDACPTCKDDNA
jgi:hypothetical protein